MFILGVIGGLLAFLMGYFIGKDRGKYQLEEEMLNKIRKSPEYSSAVETAFAEIITDIYKKR